MPTDVLLLIISKDAEALMRLNEASKALSAKIPRADYLAARTQLQKQHRDRLAVYHRNCSRCGLWVLKASMPGPRKKYCKGCWDSVMDLYSCNEWAVVRNTL